MGPAPFHPWIFSGGTTLGENGKKIFCGPPPQVLALYRFVVFFLNGTGQHKDTSGIKENLGQEQLLGRFPFCQFSLASLQHRFPFFPPLFAPVWATGGQRTGPRRFPCAERVFCLPVPPVFRWSLPPPIFLGGAKEVWEIFNGVVGPTPRAFPSVVTLSLAVDFLKLTCSDQGAHGRVLF